MDCLLPSGRIERQTSCMFSTQKFCLQQVFEYNDFYKPLYSHSAALSLTHYLWIHLPKCLSSMEIRSARKRIDDNRLSQDSLIIFPILKTYRNALLCKWRELKRTSKQDNERLESARNERGADMVHARELIKLAACDVIDYGQLITGVHPCAVICHSQSEALVLPSVKVTYMAVNCLLDYSHCLCSCVCLHFPAWFNFPSSGS